MISRRTTNNNMKRDRSRSQSSDRDSYERTSRNKNERSERPSRFSGGGGGDGGGGGRRGNYLSRKVYVSNITFDATYLEVKEEFNTAFLRMCVTLQNKSRKAAQLNRQQGFKSLLLRFKL